MFQGNEHLAAYQMPLHKIRACPYPAAGWEEGDANL